MSTDINWHPLTPDVVFEDGAIYLLREKDDASYCLTHWYSKGKCFFQSWYTPIDPKLISHYARVNEP